MPRFVQANFWTSPYPYWNIEELGPEVYNGLKDSGLVVLKVRELRSALLGMSLKQSFAAG